MVAGTYQGGEGLRVNNWRRSVQIYVAVCWQEHTHKELSEGRRRKLHNGTLTVIIEPSDPEHRVGQEITVSSHEIWQHKWTLGLKCKQTAKQTTLMSSNEKNTQSEK